LRRVRKRIQINTTFNVIKSPDIKNEIKEDNENKENKK